MAFSEHQKSKATNLLLEFHRAPFSPVHHLNNEVRNLCRIFEPFRFADDRNLLFQKPSERGFGLVNFELQRLSFCLNVNRLALCIHKSRVFSKTQGIRCSISMDSISISESSKYLGIHIDAKLEFNNHVFSILKRISKYLSFVAMFRLSVQKYNSEILQLLYET